jgi:hypothetical protein
MNQMLLTTLIQENESEFLDFKREYHDNNVKLIHDILCLANSYYDRDRYLIIGIEDTTKNIIGVENDSNRKTNANLQDLLRQSNCNRIPSIKIETVNYKNHEIDILIIGNRPDKPFFLTKDKSFKGNILRAGVVYTRLGDTNTPMNESAQDANIEMMWRERFGFGLAPLDLMYKLLDDEDGWKKIDEDDYMYHYKRPEFYIKDGKTINNKFIEPWLKSFPDQHAESFEVCLYYLSTILCKVTFVHCDGFRYRIPLPQALNGNYYIDTKSIGWKIARIYRQYYELDDNLLKCHNITLL